MRSMCLSEIAPSSSIIPPFTVRADPTPMKPPRSSKSSDSLTRFIADNELGSGCS